MKMIVFVNPCAISLGVLSWSPGWQRSMSQLQGLPRPPCGAAQWAPAGPVPHWALWDTWAATGIMNAQDTACHCNLSAKHSNCTQLQGESKAPNKPTHSSNSSWNESVGCSLPIRIKCWTWVEAQKQCWASRWSEKFGNQQFWQGCSQSGTHTQTRTRKEISEHNGSEGGMPPGFAPGWLKANACFSLQMLPQNCHQDPSAAEMKFIWTSKAGVNPVPVWFLLHNRTVG